MHELTLRMVYKDHNELALSVNLYDFEVEIVDPCLTHAIFTAYPQIDPDIYYYEPGKVA